MQFLHRKYLWYYLRGYSVGIGAKEKALNLDDLAHDFIELNLDDSISFFCYIVIVLNMFVDTKNVTISKFTLKYCENVQVGGKYKWSKIPHHCGRKIARIIHKHGLNWPKLVPVKKISQLDILDIKCCRNDERNDLWKE